MQALKIGTAGMPGPGFGGPPGVGIPGLGGPPGAGMPGLGAPLGGPIADVYVSAVLAVSQTANSVWQLCGMASH